METWDKKTPQKPNQQFGFKTIIVTCAAIETEDHKEHHSPAVPFTLLLYCTNMK